MTNYIKLFFGLTFALISSFAGYAYWAQPVSGDMTQISGLPDRLYGWNMAQPAVPMFQDPPSPASAPIVLIIGDSFSEFKFWQILLPEKYAFRFTHFRQLERVTLDEILKQHNPQIVIFESIERFAMDRIINISSTDARNCQRQTPRKPLPAISLVAANYPPMNRAQSSISFNSISQGYHALKFLLKQQYSKPAEHVVLHPLNTDKLFSSKLSSTLMSMSNDLILSNVNLQEKIGKTQCAMVALTAALRQKNIESFFFIVPDKTSAYQKYLASAQLREKPSIIHQLQQADTDNIIDLYTPATHLIERGEVDFYLPNDGHWGAVGYQLAAGLVQYHIDAHLAGQH